MMIIFFIFLTWSVCYDEYKFNKASGEIYRDIKQLEQNPGIQNEHQFTKLSNKINRLEKRLGA